MPIEWRRVHLGQLCELGAGSAFPTRYQGQAAGDFPFIKVSDMELALNQRQVVQANHWVSDEVRRELRAALHPPGATVFAKIGVALTFNRRRLLTRPTIIDNNMMSAIPSNSSVNPTYFYYLLCQVDLNDIVSGTALPYVNARDLAQIEVKLPSLPEQRAIAAILGALDDKIELNRRMNETLEARAQTLFKSWFVDFEPFRDQGMEDSPLGPIPRGWKAASLGETVNIYDSKRVPLSNRERAQRRGPYPYYGAASIMDYIDEYLFDGIYVLMAEDGSVIDDDDHPVIQYVWGKFWVNNHAHVLQGTNNVSAEHLLLFLKHVNIRPYVTGAVQPKLNQENMCHIPFILPPSDVCDSFEKAISPLYSDIRANVEQSRTLAAIRDTLLPKLLSGEIRIKDAENFVEKAV